MMVVNTSLYILSLAVYIQVEQGTCIGTDLSPISKANAVPGYVYEVRSKRASKFQMSAALISSIVKNARLLFSGQQDKVYVKSGGFKQAKKDFYELQPKNVKNTYFKGVQADKRGYLTGHSVFLNKNPQTNSAILTIVRPTGNPKRTVDMKTILYVAD